MEVLDFFNRIAEHLLKQNAACKTKSGKPLSFKGDLKDPLGFLLEKKSKWKKEYDKQGIYTPGIAEVLKLTSEQLSVVQELQAMHDLIKPEHWLEWIEIFRKAYVKT